MRYLLPTLLALHGLIHLLGFLKAYGLAALPELRLAIGPAAGALWLVAALLLMGAAAAALLRSRLWWISAAAGVLLSQALVISAWSDAAFGTVLNAALLVPIAVAAADRRRSSLRSVYRRESRRALEAAAKETGVVTREELTRLPAPVASYLERVGAVGSPRVWGVRAELRARIRGGPDDRWMEGSARQHETFDPPARLFFMEVRRAGLPVHVLHRYVGDRATMEARLLGLFPVINVSGPLLTQSETVTFLNDVFFLAPAALVDLPIEWEALDERRVRATYTNAGHTVSAVAVFGPEGDLVDFHSLDRYLMDRDPPELARWSTPFRAPADHDGVRLPSGGEARWGDEGEAWAYGDLELVRIENNPV